MSDMTGDGGSAAEQAQDKVQEVAGQAQEKAGEAAAKAQQTVRDQIDSRSTEAGERVSGTAGDLRSVGEELRKQGKDGPARLADKAAEQGEKLGSYLQDKSSDDLLHDVEDFARQRPWAALAGGLVVGIAAARFLKASSRSRYGQRSGSRSPAASTSPSSTSPTPAPTRPADPVLPAEPAVPAPPVSPAVGR